VVGARIAPRALGSLCAALLLSVSPVALAEPTTPSTPKRPDGASAETLFDQGLKAMDEGRLPEACAKLEESLRLEAAAGTLLNLATCEDKLGKSASAWGHLRHALDLLAPSDGRRSFAEAKATELERRLPKLGVRVVPALPEGARALRDGTELGAASLGVLFPVDPGKHEVTVVGSKGDRRAMVTVDVAEAESRIVVLDVGEGVTPEGRKGGGSSPRVLPLVTGGAGIAALTMGIVSGIVALERNATMNDHCGPDRVCDPVGLEAGSSGRTFANVSTISFLTAGALLAATAYLVVWGR
jgi:hypothetical protein